MEFLSVTMYFVCVPKQSALTRRTRWQRHHKEGYPGFERVWTLNLMVSRGLNVFSPPPQQVWWPLEVHKVICQPLIGGFYAMSRIHSWPGAFPVLTWSLIIEVRLVLPEVYNVTYNRSTSQDWTGLGPRLALCWGFVMAQTPTESNNSCQEKAPSW